jgi:penicillin-binding protein 1A
VVAGLINVFISYSRSFWAGLLVALAAFIALALGITVFFWAVSENFLNLFGSMPSLTILENPESEVASEIYFSDGSLIGKYYRYNRQIVRYEELSPNLVNALIKKPSN